MKITFVSNYINHHQTPMAWELYKILGDDYRFIQTEEMEEERVRMGWDSHTDSLPYLLKYYEKPEECRRLIDESDVVVFGGTDDESYITDRLQAHKPVIRCSERLYREGQWKAVSPRGLRKKYLDHTRYRKQPVYLLCAGAYVPSDFNIVKSYPDKMFRWGYFPPFVEKNVDDLFSKKKDNKVPRLLWAGRFMDCKHPEDAVALASHLKQKGIDFELVLIGGGELEPMVKELILREGLENTIIMPGFLKPEEVREEMDKADIFLFTSDYGEGWGAVLNEAMNSGLVPVANVAAGGPPFLIDHGINGFLYKNKDLSSFFSHVQYLIENPDTREIMGRSAYETIAGQWNAGNAAQVLLKLCKRLLGDESVVIPENGPGSKAPIVSPGCMYKYSVNH